jgi:hypothetical protein
MSVFTVDDAEALGCSVVRMDEPALIEYRRAGAVCSFGGGTLEDALAQVQDWHIHRLAYGAVDVVPQVAA